jgi:uncharacterized protein
MAKRALQMKALLAMCVGFALFAGAPAGAQNMDGLWTGAINAGGSNIPVRIHISHEPNGALTVTLDSPSQGANGLPCVNVSLKDSTLHFDLTGGAASYDGTIDAANGTITGMWKQESGTVPLNFARSVSSIAEVKRPQEPVRPYPYLEEDVSYLNANAVGVTLAGALTEPRGAGPFPAAILIAGSGPHDRDELVFGHRPFLVIADYLTRHGIAVLRYDKRGIGKSTGAYAAATSDDFASDAEAGIAYLKTRKEIDPRCIGLIGHSEGGLIAPLVAVQDPTVAWIVLLAGPGLPGADILIAQEGLIGKAAGAGEAAITQNQDMNRKIFAVIMAEKDPAVMTQKAEAIMAAQEPGSSMTPAQRAALVQQVTSPWFREFLSYDPRPTLEKVHCPVLALNGSNDLQVPSDQNLPAIRIALTKGGNKDFQVKEMTGLNHLFQHSPTGAVSEYQTIEETFSPDALDIMTTWIQQHSGI